MRKVTFTPIGVIRTPFKTRDDAPIQPSRSKGAQGTAEIRPDLAEGLTDLEGFSHITLIFNFHLSKSFKLKVIPYLDDVPRGVFATRAPRRPNQIGVSVVRLIKIEGTTLHIENVDMLDGTPLLDIKPYVPGFVDHAEVRTGWLENAPRKDRKKK